MKQLSKIQSLIFLLGGVLMTIGAGFYAFMCYQSVACWVYLLGATLFAVFQCMQTYEGKNFAIRRLKRIMTVADVFFVFSGLLMVDTTYHVLASAFTSYIAYYQFVYNKWVVLMLVAAILEIYAQHRISSELKKEQ